MTTQFLTIKQAAERYKKAEITIRRLVRKIVSESQEKQRTHVRPTKGEVIRLKKQQKPFAYTVSEKILDDHYRAQEEAKALPDHGDHPQRLPESEYLKFVQKTNEGLHEQLTVKDEQIRALNQALDDLGERQRETNILMRGLQEKLLLTGASSKVVDIKKRRWWLF